MTSNFEPVAAAQPGAQPTGLAASFLVKIADGLVDRLMNDESNDLVVQYRIHEGHRRRRR